MEPEAKDYHHVRPSRSKINGIPIHLDPFIKVDQNLVNIGQKHGNKCGWTTKAIRNPRKINQKADTISIS